MSNDRASSVIGYRLPFTLGHCGPQHPIYMTQNRLFFSYGVAVIAVARPVIRRAPSSQVRFDLLYQSRYYGGDSTTGWAISVY